MRGKIDEPFQKLPADLIAAFRKLDKEIYNVPYSGYVVTFLKNDAEAQQAAQPAQPEGQPEGEGEGEAQPAAQPTATVTDNEDGTVKITLPLTIQVKGDGVSLEEEAE
jgi:hypothetical protein